MVSIAQVVKDEKFNFMYIGENKQRPLAAMFFYESGQKYQFGKTISQQLFL